jgi:RNA polymerase sigma-70 factor (ECF subfamily)
LIDKELINECRKGDLSNFKKLVELTSPYAFSVAFRMLGDEEKAHDTVQDTLITIWKKIKGIKSAESYKTWLYRVVVNKCYDQIRKGNRKPEFRADDKTWEIISNNLVENPSSKLENEELAGIINLLTDRLSPKQKVVFILSELEEMTNDEIREITGMSKTKVKANLHFARKNIAMMIGKYL